jgi:cytoskeletal protein RodZ
MSGERSSADLGRRLRQARERRGLSLSQVAASTKISLAILEALEKDDLRKLPAGFFGRAFVRSFAEAVGLDPDEAVESFETGSTGRPATAARPVAWRPEDNDAFESNRQIATTFVWLAVVSAPLAALIAYFAAVGRGKP